MFAWLNIAASMGRKRKIDFLRSQEVFCAILNREQMRADRNGRTFALLILSPQATPTAADQVASLERILADRLRAMDFAGLLENRKVAVLLPDTQANGAQTLANDVCQLLPGNRPRPKCTIYEYPSDPLEAVPVADIGETNGTLADMEYSASRPQAHEFNLLRDTMPVMISNRGGQ